jgi:spermidine/putrescine transport system substrate-binding protein
LDRQLSRRAFLQAGSLGGVAAFLAACGANNGNPSAAASTTPPVSSAASGGTTTTGSLAPGAIGGELNFANKIGYMDLSEDASTYPTLDEFKQRTGVTVNYDEPIDDDEAFFSTELEGALSQDMPPPWDLVVLSDWMVARLTRLGWLEAIDTAATPNFGKNLLPVFHARPFDPETKFAAPWVAGMTGIGFDRRKTGDIKSLDALWDPKFKGRITYVDDSMRDAVGLAALRLGIDPEKITKAQFDRAIGAIKDAKTGGLLHDKAGDSYVDVLAAGDAVIAMAYSADVLTLLIPSQTAEQDFQFVVPSEGGMLWTENLCMPKGVRNKKQAEAFIDYYYEPAVAARVEASVRYVSPVKGVAEILVKTDPGIARNPLAFPPADVLRRLHQFRSLDTAEEAEWKAAFAKVFGA